LAKGKGKRSQKWQAKVQGDLVLDVLKEGGKSIKEITKKRAGCPIPGVRFKKPGKSVLKS